MEKELIVLFRRLPPSKKRILIKRLKLLTDSIAEETIKIAATVAAFLLCWHPWLIH